MKKKKLIINCLLVITIITSCNLTNSKKEFYDSGKLRNELFYRNDLLFLQKTFYETGELYSEFELCDSLKDGVCKEFRKDGSLTILTNYKNDTLLKYTEFDINGKITYWYERLTIQDLPEFKRDYIKIESITDSGYIFKFSVPKISPYQTAPIVSPGKFRLIDSKERLWLIESTNDSILRVGVLVTLNEDNIKILGWNVYDLKDLSIEYVKL